MSIPTNIIWIILAVVGLLAIAFVSSNLPKPYNTRNCQGKDWKREFPHINKNKIREFLFIFIAAFAFKDNDKLKFNPNDKILEVYRALYPCKNMPDALELETLAEIITKKYGINFTSIWHENLTLGELFAAVNEEGKNESVA